LQVNLDFADIRADTRQGTLEGAHADRAPWARHIGYDIDSHG
jgi:hypothetical protein